MNMHNPAHPGEIIQEYLNNNCDHYHERLWEIALGMSYENFIDNVTQNPVTKEIATRLNAIFGTGENFWLDLQKQYDEWQTFKNE